MEASADASALSALISLTLAWLVSECFFRFTRSTGKPRTGCNCRFGCDWILEPGGSIIQYVIDVFTYWEFRRIFVSVRKTKNPDEAGFWG